MRPKIVIAGGGTGGHLIPNVVMAELIAKHIENIDIIQIATTGEVDKHVFKLHNVPQPIFLKAAPFSKLGWLTKIRSFFRLLLNTFVCIKIFMKMRPKLVIGVGGYSSISAVLAAFCLRIPIILQEQNRIPGRANRNLSRFAKHVLLGFEDSAKYFSSKRLAKKCIFSGNFNLGRLQQSEPHHSPPPLSPPCLFVADPKGPKRLTMRFWN